jgi:hypothetical protein
MFSCHYFNFSKRDGAAGDGLFDQSGSMGWKRKWGAVFCAPEG